MDAKLNDALETVRTRSRETVVGVKDVFERALRAFQGQETRGPDAPDLEAPSESSSQRRREPTPNPRRGLRSIVGKRTEEPAAATVTDVRQEEDGSQVIRLDPEQAEPPPTDQAERPQLEQAERSQPPKVTTTPDPAARPQPEHAAPSVDEKAIRPEEERGERRPEAGRRGNLWSSPPGNSGRPSAQGGPQAQTSPGPLARGAMTAAPARTERKDPAPAPASGERRGAGGNASVTAAPEAVSRPSGSGVPTGATRTISSAGAGGIAVTGRSRGRVPIGTSMLLTVGSAAALAIGWAAGEAALVWTSVGSGMGAAMFLAVGHRRISGRAKHSISRPDIRPSAKTAARSPGAQSGPRRPGEDAKKA